MLSSISPTGWKHHMPSSRSTPTAEWRSRHPVLVLEAQSLGSVAVIRSLGRGGYPVHACDPRVDALGLLSKYVHAKAICPNYDQEAFQPWLRQYIRQYNIQAIIPSEALLLALRTVFSEFTHLLPFSNQPKTLFSGMSKSDLFES